MNFQQPRVGSCPSASTVTSAAGILLPQPGWDFSRRSRIRLNQQNLPTCSKGRGWGGLERQTLTFANPQAVTAGEELAAGAGRLCSPHGQRFEPLLSARGSGSGPGAPGVIPALPGHGAGPSREAGMCLRSLLRAAAPPCAYFSRSKNGENEAGALEMLL